MGKKLIQGVQNKMRQRFCLISLVTNMLESWDIFHYFLGVSEVQTHFYTISGSSDISKTIWGTRFEKKRASYVFV